MDKNIETTNQINFILFSTGDFGKLILENLVKINFKPSLLITGEAKRKGRGLKLKDPEIKKIAELSGIKTIQTENPDSIAEEVKKLSPDFIVVVDYGKILSRKILEIPKYVPLNIHPSLLPKWRGAAPIERAIMNGDKEIGLTIFIMDEKIDHGDILYQTKIPINEGETKGEIMEKLAPIAAEKLKETIKEFLKGKIKPKKQKGKVTYARKIKKEELWIDWDRDAFFVARHINALSPKPGAKTRLKHNLIVKILKAIPRYELSAKPAEIKIHNKKLFIGCKKGVIEVIKIQPQNKKIMSATDFICGYQKFLI